MDKKKEALKLAERCHEGHVRKVTYAPYISHPISVAEMVSKLTNEEDLVIAAYLHDVLELRDTAAGKEESKKNKEEIVKEIKSISPKALEYVQLLTHEDPEDYFEYIKRVSTNKPASLIKFCDILDNLTANPTEKQKEKYKKALIILFERYRAFQ